MTIQSILPNCVKETTTSQGTGSIALLGAAAGFQGFSDVIADGHKVCYVEEQLTLDGDGNVVSAQREVGLGTLTHGSPDTLSRDYIAFSTNGGAAVNWGPGTKDIFSAPAGELIPMMMAALTAGKAGRPLRVNVTSTAFEVGAPMLGQQARSELTIAAGVVTPTSTAHTIDTEGNAASDDLTTIVTTNIDDGGLLLISADNAARAVVVKHAASPGAGEIYLIGGADLTLNDNRRSLLLERVGIYWRQVSAALYGLDIVADANGNLTFRKVMVQKTANYSLVAGDRNRLIHFYLASSAQTATFLNAAAAGAGYECEIANLFASGFKLTLAVASGNGFYHLLGTNTATYDVKPGESCKVTTDGVLWMITSLTHGIASTIAPGLTTRATAAIARSKSGTEVISASNLADLYYETSEVALTSGGTGTIAHGLGVRPTSIEAWYRCKTTEGGFAVGTEFQASVVAAPGLANSNGVQAYTDDNTNIKYVQCAFGAQLMRALDTTGAGFQMTSIKWAVFFRVRP